MTTSDDDIHAGLEALLGRMAAGGDGATREEGRGGSGDAVCTRDGSGGPGGKRAAAQDLGDVPVDGGTGGPGGQCAAAQDAPRDAYRVERVLKDSSSELTQLVWFRGSDGTELGPFVRKYLAAGAGLGEAYRELAQARREGRHFRHLPAVLSCREEGGHLVVVVEYVPGPTLRDAVRSVAPERRLALVARLFPGVCDAVRELHESFRRPLIHRDLTPSNVVLPEGEPTTPVLIDLGISRAWKAGASADTTRFGTACYAPPEQFGFGQTDVRSDVYALGMTLLFCLTGRDPEPADRDRAFALPGVPESLRRVVAHACELDPARRFASARELGEAFARALAESGVSDRAPVVGERAVLAERVVSAGPSVSSSGSPAAPAAPETPGSPTAMPGVPAATLASPVGSPVPPVFAAAAVSPSVSSPLASGTPVPAPATMLTPPAPPTLAGGDATESPREPPARGGALSARVRSLAWRVPAWVGVIWNVCLLADLALVLLGCVWAIRIPNAHDSDLPFLYRLLEYGVCMPALTCPFVYALLDRRRLRRRFPSLARRGILAETGICLCVMLGACVGVFVVALAFQAV